MTSLSEVGHKALVELYEPINILKPVASNIWVVDGPEIAFRFAGLKMPFTTRMTVMRLGNGELLLHSPVAYTVELAARRSVPIDALLGNRSPWPNEIDVLMTTGDIFREAVLFHRSSRTLILTDLIENFEPGRMHGWLLRRLIKISGASDPDGKAPFDMQLSFLRHHRALRAAVQQMIAWRPERVILAHGRWYEGNAVAELRRAFRWVL